MGYTTDFDGSFELDKPLKPEHLAYLQAFARTRRMSRKANITKQLSDPIRLATGLPIGIDGEYYVGASNDYGQSETPGIQDFNKPPATQPSLWCQWIPDDDGNSIIWDGGEKFYDYVAWLKYIISAFIEPWGYTLNGEVSWSGEDLLDLGLIIVKDNLVTVKEGKITYN